MICIAIGLVNPAKDAGIKVPDDLDNYNHDEYVHWTVFCNVQLGRRMPSPNSHWRNAEIIAAIPDDKIQLITMSELIDLGLH